MTPVLGSALLAILVGTLGCRPLRAHDGQDGPRAQVARYALLLVGFLVTVGTVLLGALWQVHFFRDNLGVLFFACGHALDGARTALSADVGTLTVAALLGWLAWGIYTGIRITRTNHSLTRRRTDAVRLAGQLDDSIGAVVIDHRAAAAFSLPSGVVVITTAALQCLTQPQISAVIAHERAHVRGHHHMILESAGWLKRALPWVPLVRDIAAALPGVVERLADQRAAKATSTTAVAGALRALASERTPARALAAANIDVERRILDLLQPAAPRSVAHTLFPSVWFLLLTITAAFAAVSSFCRV